MFFLPTSTDFPLFSGYFMPIFSRFCAIFLCFFAF